MSEGSSLPPLSRLQRRDFLRAGAVVSGGALLAACGKDAAAPTSTFTVGPPKAGTPWFLQGDFAPVTDTMDVVQLAVSGSLPPELVGTYYRNGSNPHNGKASHWFIGDGMIHAVHLDGGKAKWYRNAYVKTQQFLDPVAASKAPPSGSNTAANVSVAYHGKKLMALGEVGHPFVLNPETLATETVFDFAGRLKTNMTAHPKIDPKTGRMHFFGYDFMPPFLTYMVAAPDGTVDVVSPIELPESHMIHDFAITENHAIFWVLPVIFSMKALKTGFPFLWDPKTACKVGVLPLNGKGDQITWTNIDPCMVFHSANAVEKDGKISVDVCWLTDAFNGKELGQGVVNELRRWTIDTAKMTLSQDTLSDIPQDFPSIDRRHVGREFRHTWFTRVEDVTKDNSGGVEFVGVGHRDDSTGKEKFWDPKGVFAPGEMFFVPRSSSADEGDGWVMGFCYDRTKDSSDLIVLDAQDVAAGPIARVHMPRRVPHGFHGLWVADADR